MSGMEVMSKRLLDTERAAADFVATLEGEKQATIIGLQGELGSGKTTFVKGVAKALGVEQTITSPTFVIEKIYKLGGQKFAHMVHIDAYRLEGGAELMTLGFREVLESSDNLVLVEWPERIKDVLPKKIAILRFAFVNEETRRIQFP